MEPARFDALAGEEDPPLDVFALALAAEFGPVDWARARDRLDALGREVAGSLSDSPRAPHRDIAAMRLVLNERHGYSGDTANYGDPRNSMLDEVIERRAGLPITLSVLWVAVARRAGVDLRGVGLPGHYVVGHFRADPPLLADPFGGGTIVATEHPPELVRPWSSSDTILRMLNNLVRSYAERGDLSRALHAAGMRLPLARGAEREAYAQELTRLEARLN
jgi:regulator of sirC expression with transglutaminase-like and TPR domain